MKRFYGLLGAVALLALVGVSTGCGETVIDSTKTEEQLQASLSKSLETKVKSVDCPSDVEVKAGTTFSCSVDFQGGETQTVTLKIRNSDADVSVVSISGSNEAQPGQ
jgi:uncharacterized protein DUF4333